MNEKTENQSQPMVRMGYETYAYLDSLFSRELKKLENEFSNACIFISSECYPDGSTGTDRAYKIFRKEYNKVKTMSDELHDMVQESYKDHPSLEMRKFWGIKE